MLELIVVILLIAWLASNLSATLPLQARGILGVLLVVLVVWWLLSFAGFHRMY